MSKEGSEGGREGGRERGRERGEGERKGERKGGRKKGRERERHGERKREGGKLREADKLCCVLSRSQQESYQGSTPPSAKKNITTSCNTPKGSNVQCQSKKLKVRYFAY